MHKFNKTYLSIFLLLVAFQNCARPEDGKWTDSSPEELVTDGDTVEDSPVNEGEFPNSQEEDIIAENLPTYQNPLRCEKYKYFDDYILCNGGNLKHQIKLDLLKQFIANPLPKGVTSERFDYITLENSSITIVIVENLQSSVRLTSKICTKWIDLPLEACRMVVVEGDSINLTNNTLLQKVY